MDDREPATSALNKPQMVMRSGLFKCRDVVVNIHHYFGQHFVEREMIQKDETTTIARADDFNHVVVLGHGASGKEQPSPVTCWTDFGAHKDLHRGIAVTEHTNEGAIGSEFTLMCLGWWRQLKCGPGTVCGWADLLVAFLNQAGYFRVIINVIDKLVFAVLLFLAIQVPLLSDHYLQYVKGQYDVLKTQVEAYEALAQTHGYSDVYDMIKRLQQDSNAVVRDDADLKHRNFDAYAQAEYAVGVLRDGNYFEKMLFMLNPSHHRTLNIVLADFRVGIVVSLTDLMWSVITALLLGSALIWPLRFTARHRHR